MWAEGRLKVEPWLAPRLRHATVRLWPQSQVVAADGLPDGALRVTLDSSDRIDVDQIILATGYRVDLARVPLLAGGNVLARLATRDGYPVLDEHFQTSLDGLYITSMPAARDFGPFFAFTIAVRTSARLIGQDLRRRSRSPAVG